VDWGYDDPAVHWEKTMKLAAPIADAVNDLDQEEQQRLRDVVAARVQEEISKDPAAIHGHTWVVTTS